MAEDNHNNEEAIAAEEELLISIPSTIVHLIDNHHSIELAYGDLDIVLLNQNDATVAVLARIENQLQWPLTKNESTLKLDDSHYLFTLTNKGEVLNYELTIPSEGQEELLEKFYMILDKYSGLKEVEVAPNGPNVEEYRGSVAKMIAAGLGVVVKGILWCGDVMVERLKWMEEFLRKKMERKENVHVSPQCFEYIQRVKSMTKKSEDIAIGILSGVIKVSEKLTGTLVYSGPGKIFFKMLPGEIILASFDGFNKVWDAAEVAGKNVMSTFSSVTAELVSERYGEEAATATNEGLDAAGHAIGTAWAVFKIGKALNPSAIKPTTLAKHVASKAMKAI